MDFFLSQILESHVVPTDFQAAKTLECKRRTFCYLWRKKDDLEFLGSTHYIHSMNMTVFMTFVKYTDCVYSHIKVLIQVTLCLKCKTKCCNPCLIPH